LTPTSAAAEELEILARLAGEIERAAQLAADDEHRAAATTLLERLHRRRERLLSAPRRAIRPVLRRRPTLAVS